MKSGLIVFFTMIALLSTASSDFWISNIATNSSAWTIHRQSGNVSYIFSSSVEGEISPIDFYNRVLYPYQSSYIDVNENDLRLRERTNAQEGKYKSTENIELKSSTDNSITINYYKLPGSNSITFSFFEAWPAYLVAGRTLEYSGRQINDHDFIGNNRDYVSSDLLYNYELSEKRKTVMQILRMNATVSATDDAILWADFKPTKYLGYISSTNTTGIANIGYKQSDSHYDVKRRSYPIINEGNDRYSGRYNLERRIEMRSAFENYSITDEWLPCYSDGLSYISFEDVNRHSTDIIFDCSCYI